MKKYKIPFIASSGISLEVITFKSIYRNFIYEI